MGGAAERGVDIALGSGRSLAAKGHDGAPAIGVTGMPVLAARRELEAQLDRISEAGIFAEEWIGHE
jgi:hypothetical protein